MCLFVLPGIISDCHKRHTWAPEPWEAFSRLPRLPEPLLGNGCWEKRWRKRAASGEKDPSALKCFYCSIWVDRHWLLWGGGFFSLFSASLLEAGKATFQSHTSHPGSQGGDEGQSLAWAQSYPAFPCCAQTCANPIVFCFYFVLFVPDNWLWVTCFFGCTSLKRKKKPWQTSLWRRPKI